MQTYLSKGKELLKLLTNNGYEGYFVGEAVRNTILKIDFSRVDIITDASVNEILRIFRAPSNNFPSEDILKEDENTVRVRYYDYDFYFHPFNTNNSEGKFSILNKHYSKELIEDLSSKNFTINAIAMSYNGKITDQYNAIEDLKIKRIRTVINPRQRFVNEPLDILEAIVLKSELNFDISEKTYSGIRKRSKLLLSVDSDAIAKKIEKILNAKYAKKGIKDLVRLHLEKYVPLLNKGLKKLARRYHKVSMEDLILMSFVLNEQMDDLYNPFITDFESFKRTYNLALANRKAKYDTLTLFSYGLDNCIRANYINYCLGRSFLKKKWITKEYEKLPIKKPCDLAYKGDEILRITSVNDTDMINDIMDEVILKILEGNLKNDYNDIQKEVTNILNARGIYFDLNRHLEVNKNDEIEVVQDNNIDVLEEELEKMENEPTTSERLKILEERLDEQNKILQEKSERLEELEKQKILEVSNKVVNNTIELAKRDGQIASVITDLDDFEVQLRDFLNKYLKEGNNNNEED